MTPEELAELKRTAKNAGYAPTTLKLIAEVERLQAFIPELESLRYRVSTELQNNRVDHYRLVNADKQLAEAKRELAETRHVAAVMVQERDHKIFELQQEIERLKADDKAYRAHVKELSDSIEWWKTQHADLATRATFFEGDCAEAKQKIVELLEINQGLQIEVTELRVNKHCIDDYVNMQQQLAVSEKENEELKDLLKKWRR